MPLTHQELLAYFQHEAHVTQRVFEALTDASLTQQVTEKDRSLGEIAWHLVTSIPEMLRLVGLAIPGPQHHDPAPQKAEELARAYRQVSEAAHAAMANQWDDAALSEVHEVYGYRWSKAQTVAALIAHQTHHRGAMTVLMRQAGLRVPEIYGPTRDSHAA